jgi:metal-responsive CopG/Arc/MetJ family transcriptional regulator
MSDRLARLMILLPPDLLAEIDEHRRAEPDIPPRTEAIRRLIRAGLEAAKRAPVKRRAA